MLARVAFTWAFAVAVIGGTAYYMFPWFGVRAVGILAVLSGIIGAIAVFLVRRMYGGGGGSGSGTARASKYDSKGARGGDR